MSQLSRHQVDGTAALSRLPRSERGTFVFATHLSFTYGHVARCHKIAREFVEVASFDAHVVTSTPEFTTGEMRAGINEILLPPPLLPPSDGPAAEGSGDRLESPNPDASDARRSRHRSRLLEGLARHLQPRGILLEGFPFVWPLRAGGECGAPLRWLRREIPEALRCAGFNGVPIERHTASHGALIRELLTEHIDLLFVYVDEAERAEVLRTCPFLRGIEAKLRFVGYVGGPPAPVGPRTRRILATFGGGGHAYDTLRLVCEALLIFASRQPDYGLEVVTGGRLPDLAYRDIARRYGDRLRVTKFVPGLGKRFAEYDLVLAMGGYNTCAELYRSSTRSIVLPRIAPEYDEQLVQARKFQTYGGVDHVVEAASTLPESLARLVEETLAAPASTRRPVAMDGARRAAEIITAEVERRRVPRPAHFAGTEPHGGSLP